MKLIVTTPYGVIESLESKEVSAAQAREAVIELVKGPLNYLEIHTEDGVVVLFSKCAKQSMVKIVE